MARIKTGLQKVNGVCTQCFKLTPPPSFYIDETSAITGGEGLEPKSSPKPKTLAKKDTLFRKIGHNTTKVGQKKGGELKA